MGNDKNLSIPYHQLFDRNDKPKTTEEPEKKETSNQIKLHSEARKKLNRRKNDTFFCYQIDCFSSTKYARSVDMSPAQRSCEHKNIHAFIHVVCCEQCEQWARTHTHTKREIAWRPIEKKVRCEWEETFFVQFYRRMNKNLPFEISMLIFEKFANISFWFAIFPFLNIFSTTETCLYLQRNPVEKLIWKNQFKWLQIEDFHFL